MPGISTQRFWILFVFNHAPQNRQAYDVKAEGFKLIPIALFNPVIAEDFDQAFFLFVDETFGEFGFQRALVVNTIAPLSHHPEFLHQPVAEVGTFQIDWGTGRFYPFITIGFEQRHAFIGDRAA